jgi:UrcA family protein
MKILNTNLFRLITNAIIGSLAFTVGVPSMATNVDDVPQVVVKYGDLKSNPQGAATLYGRIFAAAHVVCRASFPNSEDELLLRPQMFTCIHNTIRNAVGDVGKPELFAIYNVKNPREPLPIVAAAPTR